MGIRAAAGARVPWQCSSAKGESILRRLLIEAVEREAGQYSRTGGLFARVAGSGQPSHARQRVQAPNPPENRNGEKAGNA